MDVRIPGNAPPFFLYYDPTPPPPRPAPLWKRAAFALADHVAWAAVRGLALLVGGEIALAVVNSGDIALQIRGVL